MGCATSRPQHPPSIHRCGTRVPLPLVDLIACAMTSETGPRRKALRRSAETSLWRSDALRAPFSLPTTASMGATNRALFCAPPRRGGCAMLTPLVVRPSVFGRLRSPAFRSRLALGRSRPLRPQPRKRRLHGSAHALSFRGNPWAQSLLGCRLPIPITGRFGTCDRAVRAGEKHGS